MNDFTKEELLELLYALDCCHNIPTGVKSPPLMIKIKSMIDNYCEHQKSSTDFTTVYPCKHCGEFYR